MDEELEELEARWQLVWDCPFPAGSGSASGIDLVLVDLRISNVLRRFFAFGRVEPAEADMLRDSLGQCELALPALNDKAHAYFAEVLAIARAVLDRLARSPYGRQSR